MLSAWGPAGMRLVRGVRLDLLNREIHLGAAELAVFGLEPRGDAGLAGRWRAESGRQWHGVLGKEVAAEEGLKLEQRLEGTLVHGGWKFVISGRLDQIQETGAGTLIREVKTVTERLPVPPEDFPRRFPGHCAQAACYRRLRALAGPPPEVELLLLEIGSGLRQTVRWTEDWDGVLTARLQALAEFAEERRSSAARLRSLGSVSAFDAPRPGQTEAREELARIETRAGTVLFEAPTGFGKTGLAWEHALRGLRDGRWDRVIYLTGKTSGQRPASAELRALLEKLPAEARPRVLQFRPRSELCACADPRSCRKATRERWAGSGFSPRRLLEADPFPEPETIAREARSLGLCGHEAARACLPLADIWIGDANYLLAPSSRHIFLESPGFFPDRTLLIADEAHLLPSRAADARSASARTGPFDPVEAALRAGRASSATRLAWDNWREFLGALEESRALPAADRLEARALLDSFVNELFKGGMDWDAPAPDELDALRAATVLAGIAEEADGLPRLWWSPGDGELRADCLDAAPALGETLAPFRQCLLMSATLSPAGAFATACGLPEETTLVRAEAPWREGAHRVAVDARADTRLKTRADHYALTAETAVELARCSNGPAVVFFPSHRYAETIAAYIAALAPELRVAQAPRGFDAAGQADWVREALICSDLILIVVGTGFAEGIDEMGGVVSDAIVVGPALPEMNPVQEARRARLEETLGGDEAFVQTYALPGMTRVNQALGRLVRAPGQKARIILHCRRFLRPEFAPLLAPEYRDGKVIRSREALGEWLLGR